jgi:hypothetical protein
VSGASRALTLVLSAVLPRIRAWLRFYARAEPPASRSGRANETQNRSKAEALPSLQFFFLPRSSLFFTPQPFSAFASTIINYGSPPQLDSIDKSHCVWNFPSVVLRHLCYCRPRSFLSSTHCLFSRLNHLHCHFHRSVTLHSSQITLLPAQLLSLF